MLKVDREAVPEKVWIVVQEPDVCPTCRQQDYDVMNLEITLATVMGIYWERQSGDLRLRLMYGDYNEVEVPPSKAYSSESLAEQAKYAMKKSEEEV